MELFPICQSLDGFIHQDIPRADFIIPRKDRTLIAGDAFVTVKQEYLYKVITQEQEISGPPRYLTTDWKAAKESVLKLEKLKPLTAVTGHGIPMSGELLSTSLKTLVQEFDKIAVPDYGKYIDKRCIKRENTLFIFILTNQNMIQNQNTKNIKFNMKNCT